MIIRSVIPALATLLFATTASAAADVRVTMPQPAAAYVYDPSGIDVVVANIGNKRADGVVLTIHLPLTHTTPVLAMGDVSGLDPRCSRSVGTITCTLNSINKAASTTVSFDMTLPVADQTLVISASATSTSAENSLANNSASVVPPLLHYDVPVSAGDSAIVEHCTGTGLTSFYECLQFPGSLSSFDVDFVANNQLSFQIDPNYGGTWSQTPPGALQSDPEYLSMSITELGTVVAEFEGWGSSNTPDCFDGMTTFPGSTWVAPYRVCI
ncbi:MAG: DUF11 domain-containing protein [Nannocystaceae bacterium]|nr:DUF11 domain-containing protein [Nannocystaceae bacterium]